MSAVRYPCHKRCVCARQTLTGVQLHTEPQTCSIIFSGSSESDYLLIVCATYIINEKGNWLKSERCIKYFVKDYVMLCHT